MTRSLRLSAILLFTAGVYGASDTCCDRLASALSRDKVFKPSNTNYAVENQKYWSSTAILSPGCVFVPESSADVFTAVKVFTKHNCQFAVRGGGHSTNPGWAGTNSGVLVSLSKLTTIEVSRDTQSVVVGAGNRWGDVYAKTGEHNVTVAGGRISKVGVSGFLLGGGLSFLMHKEGFAANNVLSYEIVLANGKVTTVTAQSNSDLFKALKGGTSNFGIVTSFTLHTFPVNYIYAGYLYYAPDQYDNLFPLMETYARQGPESDPKTHVISVFLCNPSQNVDMATFYTAYSDPVTAPPAAIKSFFDVPSVKNTVQVKTVKQATDELEVGFDDGLRYNMQDYSIRADAGLFKQIFDIWHSTTVGLNTIIPGWSSGIIYQPISNSMIRASEKKGGNVLGLEPAEDPLMVVTYQFTWKRPEDDKKAYAAINQLVTTSTKLAKSQNRLERYMYLNYAGSDQKVIESYGPAQVDYMRKVRAKYDPDRVFEKLSRGGFKIPS
ncbi:6-hydroxy-D-nicotine oxidase [Rhizoctonia solani 123E]|uniref:6-hydroxy-D-nicotine oxidase n=2 Tax=Rhizoctonia solani AG-3 TaxID=1086053 RepID=A0A074S6N3_9AGAM|nr:6-hydroxy-D-nicotine oxidase [Rhizoctonia solani 123E]